MGFQEPMTKLGKGVNFKVISSFPTINYSWWNKCMPGYKFGEKFRESGSIIPNRNGRET